jgi:hypothetical protein
MNALAIEDGEESSPAGDTEDTEEEEDAETSALVCA